MEVGDTTYRALDEERILSAFTDPMLQYDTTRYELVDATPTVVGTRDFKAGDFLVGLRLMCPASP